MTTVVNLKRDKYDIYIGRGSKWGNPYTHLPMSSTRAKFQVATREESIERYAEYLASRQDLIDALPELKDKVLGCYCKPQSCHGDILAELVNGLEEA